MTKLKARQTDSGVEVGQLVVLENVGGSPGLPAVDGSQLLNLPSPELDLYLYGSVISVTAGSFADVDVVNTSELVVAASIQESGAPGTYFDLWEILWRTNNAYDLCGRFLGPGVTTMIGSPPSAPTSGRVRFRIYNRDGSNRDFRLLFHLSH